MKNLVTRVLLVVLVGLTACSSKLPEITSNTTPAIQGSLQPDNTINTTPPAFTFTRSMGPVSTSNVTVPGLGPGPVPITPPGGPVTQGPLASNVSPGGQMGDVYSVNVEFVPSQPTFGPGQTVDVSVKLTNTSTKPVFVTLPLKADFVIPAGPDSGTVVHSFPAGSQEETLGVNEIISYNITWDQKDENGTLVAPGWYFVDYRLTIRAESSPPGQWGEGGRNKLFLIQSPQPALVKTINLNQSINVTGLGIQAGNSTNMSLIFTLKQVEMTDKGTSFLVVVTSAESPAPNYEDVEWQLTPVFAQFVVDGTIHDARASNTISTASGIELRWGANGNYLDPVPVGTKELTFRITKMGQHAGPWDFKIPLQ